MGVGNTNILLVVPRFGYTNDVNYNYTFPLGLGYISSVLKKAGFHVDVLNINHVAGSVPAIVDAKLSKTKYSYVLTGHLGIGYFAVEAIFKATKKHPTRPKTILGGSIITSEPDVIFNALKPDYGILGEGELTIVELLCCLEKKGDLRKVNGIMYCDKKKTVMTRPRETIKDLDSIPFPDFDGLGFDKILDNTPSNGASCPELNNLLDHPRIYPIMCSRSCPNQCTFCYHTLGREYRIRSMDNIFAELAWAKKRYGINGLVLTDDLFAVDKERTFEFCRRLKILFKGTKVRWLCALTVRDIDDAFLKRLKNAGCSVIGYGFESMSPTVLKSMKKPITPELIDNAVKLMFKNRITLSANFIFGDIAETKETAYETLDYWKKSCKGQVGLTFIQAYPGSKIYEYTVKNGKVKDRLKFIKDLNTAHFLFNITDAMTEKEFNQLKKDIRKADADFGKYKKTVMAESISPYPGGRYTVVATCPYCRTRNTYNNFHIGRPRYFYYFTVCKHCRMRYGISTPIKKLIDRNQNTLLPLMRLLAKTRKQVLRRAVQK